MITLVKNIAILAGIDPEKHLCRKGSEMSVLNTIENAYLIVKDGKFDSYGKMEQLDEAAVHADEVVDAKGGTVLPSWCDSHTHIVYAGSREGEFEDKIKDSL